MEKFNTLEEAREWADENGIGKYDYVVVEIAGKKTLLLGTDMVLDEVWSSMYELLEKYGKLVGLEPDNSNGALTDTASRLRDELLEAAEKIYGVEYETVYDEY